MRVLGLIALAGAGLGYLMFTDKGKSLTKQAGQCAQDAYAKVSDAMQNRDGSVEKVVHNVLDKPHPDTAMASAFEAAVTS